MPEQVSYQHDDFPGLLPREGDKICCSMFCQIKHTTSMAKGYVFASLTKGGYVFTSLVKEVMLLVGLVFFVCLSVYKQHYVKGCKWIAMKFYGMVWGGKKEQPIRF